MGTVTHSRPVLATVNGRLLQHDVARRIQYRRGTEGSKPARVGQAKRRGIAVKKSELETFDGRDNRKEIMLLLCRLGNDHRRKVFIEGLIPHSLRGFAGCPMKVTGACDPVSAYYMMVSVCNELGVSINTAATALEKEVKRLT